MKYRKTIGKVPDKIVEEIQNSKHLKPQYQNIHDWEFYSSNLITEYTQSIEEGLDIEKYKDVFYSISKLPKDETQIILDT